MILQTFLELSEEELDRIERLAQAATVGPWLSYVVGRDAGAGWNRVELGVCNELGSFKSIEFNGATIADQDFIASARQDVPRLVHEVRALRALLDSMHIEPDSRELPAIRSFSDTSTPPVPIAARI
jgi:hypothetical protein